MILNILLLLSKCIKPFLKKNFYQDFTLVEDMLIYNFIFFVFALIFYIFNNKKYDLINKFNFKNIKLTIVYLLLTAFELYAHNIILKNNNITNFKIIQKALYIIITPIFGIYFFKEKVSKKIILGIIIISIGTLFIN